MTSNEKEIKRLASQALHDYYAVNSHCTDIRIREENSLVTFLGDGLYLYTCLFRFSLDSPVLPAAAFDEKATLILRQSEDSFECIHMHCPAPSLLDQFARTYTELEQSNQQMQVILNTIQGGIKISKDDEKGTYLYVSKELCALFGYTVDEFMEMSSGSAIGAVYPPDAAQVQMKIMKAFRGGGTEYMTKYRIRCKDGSLKWIVDSGKKVKDEFNNTIINSLYLDITDLELGNQKIAEQRDLLEKERERFRIAMENTCVIIFEYDIARDRYTSYGSLEKVEEREDSCIEQTVSHFIRDHIKGYVPDSYLEQMVRLLIGSAEREGELPVALSPGDADYVWTRVSVTPVLDRDNKIVKTIGKFTNIQSEKEKEIALEELNSLDSLTKLYNKESGIRRVQEYMASKRPEQICALMLFDMDDFQKINEEQGHIFADAVLQEVADILRSETSPEDICIRLGGDEFMIFVKDCNKARASSVGTRIASMIQELFKQETPKLSISASIGMCVTAVVDEYSGLYRCAESTLKYVKKNNKGHAACYLDTSNELGTMLTQVYKEKHFINSIEHLGDFQDQDLISFALELLGKSKNLDDALFLLLARIGRSSHFDRVSIMEIDPDYYSGRYTHQWAHNSSDMLMNQEYYMSKQQLTELLHAYDEDGICTHRLPSIQDMMDSCLHAAMMNQGTCTGILAFERKEAGYCWTDKERKLIKEMVKIISSFIMKAHADAISQAKTDFLSRMSHEIRTPMNAISGMTAIAKSGLNDPEKTLNCLNKIESANAYLLTLINDILDMSKIESGKLSLNEEAVRLSAQMDDLDSMLRPQADAKNIHFTIHNGYSADHILLLDPLRLNQVLINIIGNALKFTGENGSVTVTIETLKETEQYVRLSFSITDNGIGITDNEISRIFNAFEQARKDSSANYGGTGLGLSISSKLVQMMGGLLNVESEEGQGSTFYFTLQFPHGDELESTNLWSTKENMTISPDDFTGRRLLVAEDNDLNREIAVSLLEMNGFFVDSVTDGQEAVDVFEKYEPYSFDAILMDIRMPRMDGLEAARRIRTLGKADSRTIPIIAMTANAFDRDSEQSIASGMNGHLSKPIEVDKLLLALKKCFLENKRL